MTHVVFIIQHRVSNRSEEVGGYMVRGVGIRGRTVGGLSF